MPPTKDSVADVCYGDPTHRSSPTKGRITSSPTFTLASSVKCNVSVPWRPAYHVARLTIDGTTSGTPKWLYCR